MNELAIVICNYNKKAYVLDCLRSVFESDDKNFDVIVVDNASTDGSVEAIRTRYGDRLTLLINEENTGGSGGFNRGMQYAVNRDYKYIHLLDNDVVLDKAAIGALYRFMENNPNAGACGSLISYYTDPQIIAEMGALIDKPLLGLKSLYHQACVEDAPAAVTCDYVAACSAIYKVDALKRSGIMNPQYFVLWDDIELSTVIRLSGYTIHAISAAIAYHHFEFKGANLTFPHYYSLRNKIYYFTKFLSDAEFVQFPEMLTKRFYRMMVCGKDNIPVISTYMHALNDGLNGIMGKADDYKIVTLPNEKKWHGILKGKRSIVIRFDPAFITLKTLLVDLEAFCDAKITIVSGGTSLSNVTLGRAVSIVEQAVAGDYDLEIFTCCHVLDFSYESIAFTEGGTLVIDNYGNTAADCGDVASYRRQEENYAVFRAMLYKYIKDKLCAVREHYKQC